MTRIALPAVLLLAIACARNGDPADTTGPETVPWEEMRRTMVSLIREDGVAGERVLDAMLAVERHRFVAKEYRRGSYGLYPLPIGEGQTISSPYIVAVMTEMLELDGSEKVLEIGTGSGYQAAVLAELAAEVYTIEIVEPLASRAASDLKRLGFEKLHVRAGDGYRGWPEAAPFDAIIVTAAPDHIPQPLVDQLAVGGRLVIPVGRMFQELVLITKDERGVRRDDLLAVRFVPMVGEAEKKR